MACWSKIILFTTVNPALIQYIVLTSSCLCILIGLVTACNLNRNMLPSYHSSYMNKRIVVRLICHFILPLVTRIMLYFEMAMFILCLLAYLPFVIIFTSDIGKKVIATQKLNTCCCKEQLTAFFLYALWKFSICSSWCPVYFEVICDLVPNTSLFSFGSASVLILHVVQGYRHWQNINLIFYKAPHGKVKGD